MSSLKQISNHIDGNMIKIKERNSNLTTLLFLVYFCAVGIKFFGSLNEVPYKNIKENIDFTAIHNNPPVICFFCFFH